MKKAQALLASYFLFSGQEEAAERIGRSFQELTRHSFEGSRRLPSGHPPEILGGQRAPDEYRIRPGAQREKLKEFFASLAGAPSP